METQETNTGTERVDAQPVEPVHNKNTGMAVVAYILFFVPLLTDAKHDSFVLFHVRQGFVLFVAWVFAGILSMIIGPLMFIGLLAQVGLLVLFIIGIMNALGGKEEPLPLIGQFSNKAPF